MKYRMNYVGVLSLILFTSILGSIVDMYGRERSCEGGVYTFWDCLLVTGFITAIFFAGKYSKFKIKN